MKRLIFLLFFIPAICSGQAVYISFQPADLGFGLRGDYKIFYGSLSYGNGGIYRNYDLDHHVKITAGVMIPLKPDASGFEFYPSVGINYHTLNHAEIGGLTVDPKIFNPLSFELGLTVYMGRFALGMRTDILRWEPCVDLGFKF
jgi:hypothetical protein